jgi:hypothetical protein
MHDFLEFQNAGNLAAAEAQRNGTHAIDKLEQIYADAYAKAFKMNHSHVITGTKMSKRKILKTRKTRRKYKPY